MCYILRLPEWFVVPAAINDARLSNLAERLKGSRPPFWVWGDSHGAAIIRMGKLHNEADSSSENAFFEILRKSHPEKIPPQIFDLEINLPMKEIKQSFHRLLELCCPESLSQYEESDSRFLSLLEHTKWMWWVSRAIQISGDVAEKIVNKPEVVILQEHESRDVSCLIGSVVQLIVDPRFRTAIGLFSLIQKDWIATGHPFHSGYLHTSPVFLLFLDVVFQLCSQNPFQFEFNELLLTEIWDSVFDATSGTFLFDSPKQRKNMELRKDLSIWHKVLQKNASQVSPKAPDTFTGKANMIASSSFLFPGSAHFRPTLPASLILPQLPQRLINPMYKIRGLLYPPTRDGQNNPYLLACSSSMCDVQLWTSLYLNRTLESVPAVGMASGGISSPIALKPNEPYFPTASKQRASSTSSSSPMETTSFIYNTEASKAKTGPDSTTELKLVDILLSTLTSANRYHRNPHVSNNFSPSRMKGPSVPPRINPFSANSTNL
ncbi:unnamed protein product [Allacma fusca]|uniref:Myotubularin phosphatase domain-containing protein n=1 Tax=Allacma fusca TaxID=39272 RepID=A0A8J2LM21_9HEXA|nr:unnamed protein product [Allacma fusca]